jgi:glycerol kinase
MNYILAVDQGTHASRALVVDTSGQVVSRSLRSVSLTRPRPGWVEQDAGQIAASVEAAIDEVVQGLTATQRAAVHACGICSQRSTVLAWQENGTPLSTAINWQDTRGAPQLETLRNRASDIHRLSGLPLSAHYGASKLHWLHRLLGNDPDITLGPLVSFLLHRVTGNKRCAVDHSNAQRMQLFDIHALNWSPRLCNWFDVPIDNLPPCLPVRHDYGTLADSGIPITAVCGDQNAAWFGSGQPDAGTARVNLGSGAFILARQADDSAVPNLLSSIADSDLDSCQHLLEGTVNGAGNALQWLSTQRSLRDIHTRLGGWLEKITQPPIFLNTVGGLGSPWWEQGLAPRFVADSGRYSDAETAVAVAESALFLVKYNLEQIRKQQAILRLTVSGGLSRLGPLCQKLANLSGLPVERAEDPEASARGVAWLAAGRPEHWQRAGKTQLFAPLSDTGLTTRYSQFIEKLREYIETGNHE